MAQPRRPRLKMLFAETYKDVTEDVMADALSFTYDDKETNEADEITLTLKDPTGKWAGTWKPDGGESIRAWIIPGTTPKYTQLYCGLFYVDSMSVAGNPRTCELKAVSIPLNKPIRKKIKNRAWEKATLKYIAGAICEEAGIGLLFDSEYNPSFDRQDQKGESDLKFLSRLCEDAGLSIKMTNMQIVIFSQESYEKKKPVKTLTLGKSNIKSWSFECAQSEQYKSVTVTYRNPNLKKKGSAAGYTTDVGIEVPGNPAVISYTYTDKTVGEDGQEYTLKKRASTEDEAKRLAKAKLRALNRRHITGSISLMGDVDLVAGVVIKCAGFGSFDGNFIVEQASHKVDGGGYTTDLTLSRVNTNY